MPFTDVQTSSGLFSFCYSIATPTSKSTSAEAITPGLPCILFLHSGYFAQETFESQFNDRRLRQFNLIAIDMRGYGGTRGVIGKARFTPTESASDVNQVMINLNLPPCHIFGISNGCTVALELAVVHPERILSLTLCSPLTATESEDVAAGFWEVYNNWVKMDQSGEGFGVTSAKDDRCPEQSGEYVQEVMTGATQLLVNHAHNNLVQSMSALGLVVAKRNWSGSQEKLDDGYKTSVEWFIARQPIPDSMFEKIRVPVVIVHCFDDVGYPLEVAEELRDRLIKAGVPKVSLREVPGAHYGNVVHPDKINRILCDTVSSCHPNLPRNPLLLDPENKGKLPTPFTDILVEYGYDPTESDSE